MRRVLRSVMNLSNSNVRGTRMVSDSNIVRMWFSQLITNTLYLAFFPFVPLEFFYGAFSCPKCFIRLFRSRKGKNWIIFGECINGKSSRNLLIWGFIFFSLRSRFALIWRNSEMSRSHYRMNEILSIKYVFVLVFEVKASGKNNIIVFFLNSVK